jgi:hypothetical protein
LEHGRPINLLIQSPQLSLQQYSSDVHMTLPHLIGGGAFEHLLLTQYCLVHGPGLPLVSAIREHATGQSESTLQNPGTGGKTNSHTFSTHLPIGHRLLSGEQAGVGHSLSTLQLRGGGPIGFGSGLLVGRDTYIHWLLIHFGIGQ